MKNIRKIIAVLLAAVLLLGAFPAAMAESSSTFSNTHWYATGINCDYIDWNSLGRSDRELLDLAGYLVKFVPYESWLYSFSFCSIYCGIDFRSNGTYSITFAVSFMGEVSGDTYATGSGTWSYRDHMLYMNGNGTPVPLTYRNGVLSLDVYGFGFNFEKA